MHGPTCRCPNPRHRPFDLWVDAIRGRADAAANVAAAIELTRLVVAANRSAAEGRAIPYDTH